MEDLTKRWTNMDSLLAEIEWTRRHRPWRVTKAIKVAARCAKRELELLRVER